MKNKFIILFSLFYLFVSTGFTVNLHYCGGNIKDFSFNQATTKQCCGGAIMNKNCCNNKTISIKAAEKHTVNQTVNISYSHFTPHCPLPVICVFNHFKNILQVLSLNNHPPPLNDGLPIYLKNRILLI